MILLVLKGEEFILTYLYSVVQPWDLPTNLSELLQRPTDRLNHHEPACLLGSSDGMWLKPSVLFCLTPGARETASSLLG